MIDPMDIDTDDVNSPLKKRKEKRCCYLTGYSFYYLECAESLTLITN